MAPALPQSAGRPGEAAAVKGSRKAYFPEAQGYVDTPVYDRYALRPGTTFDGPAIIEERESTTVIGPGARVRVDATLTVIAEPAAHTAPPRAEPAAHSAPPRAEPADS